MQGPISFSELMAFLSFVAGLLVLWARVETRISSTAKEAITKVNLFKEQHELRILSMREEFNLRTADLKDTVADLELKISKEYASLSHLQEVEKRLTTALDKLRDIVQDLPREIASAIADKDKSDNPRKSGRVR